MWNNNFDRRNDMWLTRNQLLRFYYFCSFVLIHLYSVCVHSKYTADACTFTFFSNLLWLLNGTCLYLGTYHSQRLGFVRWHSPKRWPEQIFGRAFWRVTYQASDSHVEHFKWAFHLVFQWLAEPVIPKFCIRNRLNFYSRSHRLMCTLLMNSSLLGVKKWESPF